MKQNKYLVNTSKDSITTIGLDEKFGEIYFPASEQPNLIKQNMSETAFNPDYLASIAKVCHQANKAFCEKHNDHSQKDWEEAEEWQRESALKGVVFRINNPESGHDAQHNSWMKEKIEAGWVYGETKDAEAKTHPCITSFETLPLFQQQKDALFCAIVDAIK